MANFFRKRENTQSAAINFNTSTEINYWASRYNVSPAEFRKIFEACGSSLSQTIRFFIKGNAA